MYLPTFFSTSWTIGAWSITCSSYDAIGWRLKNRSWPLWAATSAAARVSSSVLLMCSMLTWTSFFWPHCCAHGSSHWSYWGTKCTQVRRERLPESQRPLNLIGPANENGAAAPATPSAAAPAPAFFRKSRRVKVLCPGEGPWWVSAIFPLSYRLAKSPAREAGDEPVEEGVVDEGQRNARDQDRRHDPGPVEEVTADQVGGHTDRQRAIGRARDERDRIDELVDDEREREDDNGQDA